MFTGIIEAVGTIVSVEKKGTNRVFTISSSLSAELKIDQSVAHDGVCLTVTQVSGKEYMVEAVKETLSRTTLDRWKAGNKVNLERSMRADTRVDGHFVQGHVDTVTEILSIEDRKGSWEFAFNLPEKDKELIVEKGSIVINGVSLTVAKLKKNKFSVAIIPYTFEHTNFSALIKDDKVNIEFDILGKYIRRMMK